MTSAEQALVPERVGRYEILAPLGVGGIASVYLARERGVEGFEREVALKLVHPHLRSEKDWVSALVDEAQTVARIRHPNVVPILDVGSEPAGVFLVLEYIKGCTLSALARSAIGAPLPSRVILRIMSDALAGLHAAHELCDAAGQPAQLVHRDFSPQNILVGADGVSRLTDFGIAKTRHHRDRTQEGVVKGKVAYMAPEQLRGQPIDRRADVYAAAVVAWELFAARRMRNPDKDDVALLLEIVSEEAPRLSDASDSCSPELDAALGWALESDVDDRCPSAQELWRRMQSALGGPGAVAEHAEVAAVVAQRFGEELTSREIAVRERTHARAMTGTSAEPNQPGDEPRDGDTVTTPAQIGRDDAARFGSKRLAIGVGAVALAAAGASLALRDDPAAVRLPSMAADLPRFEAPALPTAVSIVANAPFSTVRIGDREIALPAPKASVSLPLAPSERSGPLKIQLFTADGRSASFAGSVDAHPIEMEFGAVRRGTEEGGGAVGRGTDEGSGAARASLPKLPPPRIAPKPAPKYKSPYDK